METKKCSRCHQTLLLSEFGSHTSKAYRTLGRLIYSGVCRPCAASYAREWRARNKDYVKPKDTRDPTLLSFIRARRADALSRAGGACSVDYLYDLLAAQEQRCAISGLPLYTTKRHKDSASLDQIEAGKGYAEDNVQWVSWRVNRAKGDQSQDELIQMCKAILKV